MEKQSDSQDGKILDKYHTKPIMVLTRLEPTGSHFEQAKKILEKWVQELKHINVCHDVEIICCSPEQVAWMEHWNSRADLDNFNRNHFAYSEFLADFFKNSRGIPTRFAYKKLS